MVSFFGEFTDLVSTVATVAKQVGKEVVSDVRGAVKTAQEASKIHAKNATAKSPTQFTSVPASLDLKYATDRLLCMPQPTVDAWTAKCFLDERDHHSVEDIPFTPDAHPRRRNDVTVLARFLEQRHAHHYCVFNVSDTPAEDTVVRTLSGAALVHLPWRSPSSPRSETPSLCALLEIVYALHAYLQLDPDNNKAVIYCFNGRTRTALVVACYMAFSKQARTVQDAFVHFLQTTQNMTYERAKTIWDGCPPSLHTFGYNFDQTCNLCDHLNQKPLLLRAIALQGVPVEDKPCLDIWDGQQRHIYSSHPELWTDLVDTTAITDDCDSDHIPVASQPPLSTDEFSSPLQQAKRAPLPALDHPAPFSPKSRYQSQWADEEGFYRVNVVLEGDFCLLCRFGGDHAGSDKDSTKVLFRYANTTTCMGAGGPYELPPTKVDLMRRYASCFDPDDFLCTLLLEAHWNVPEPYLQKRLKRLCPNLPPVYEPEDVRALQRGWQTLKKYCMIQPSLDDVTNLLQDFHAHVGEGALRISRDMAILCLQQCNANAQRAIEELQSLETSTRSPVAKVWQILQSDPNVLPPLPDPQEEIQEESAAMKEATQNILDILDSVDFGEEFKDQEEWQALRSNENGSSSQENYSEDRRKDHQNAPSSASYMSPLMHIPRQGDIINSFGEYYQDIHKRPTSNYASQIDTSKPLTMGSSFPQLPLQHAQSSPQRPRADPLYSPVDDPANASSLELLLKMNHPGITLQDLTLLLEESRHWNKSQPSPPRKESESLSLEQEELRSSLPVEESILEAMGTGGAAAQSSSMHATIHDAAPPIKDHPEYSRFFKMAKSGTSIKDVKGMMAEEQKDPTILDLDPNKSLSSQRPNMTDQEAIYTTVNAVQNAQRALKDAVAQQNDIPKTEIVIPKKDDSKEEEEQETQSPQAKLMQALAKKNPVEESKEEDAPLRTDAAYSKYFKMLKVGMPKPAVKHAMSRDGVDPSVIELDPERSLKSQKPPPEEEPNANSTDADSTKTNGGIGAAKGEGPPLKDDPTYAKFFKMLSVGLPKDAVKNALQRDDKDPSIIDLDPEKSLKSQMKEDGDGGGGDQVKDDGLPLKDDPEFKKYFKMLQMGLPIDAVKNALQRDGKDPAIMDLDHEKSLKSQVVAAGGGGEPKNDGPPLKDDAEFKKYFKMLQMGLPIDAVKNALQRDGKDPAIMDLDHERSLQSQRSRSGDVGDEKKDTGVPLKDDPIYAKYMKMQKMGLPVDAVKNALQRDGRDPAIMDLDPNLSVDYQIRKKTGGGALRHTLSKKKKKVRRKKIYWTPLPPEQIKEDSIWNLVKGSVKMDKLNYDVKEFEDLFTESADPADRKINKKKKTDASKQKKSVQVIDGKRSMNGGIILARMKTDYRTIAAAVNEMQHRKFDATQLKALKEFLPTAEERQGLKMYMEKGESNPEARDQLYKELSECEKYMYTMIEVPKAAEKFDCMLFRSQFKVRFIDVVEGLTTVEKACDETRNSEKLRKMMATILTLVNQINTGGEEDKEAAGFSLDALLKLNEAKAFDKKTSVLMYLAKLVKKNDESLLDFNEDIEAVRYAENVVLDALGAEIKTIEAELEEVHETAAEEAARLEAADELKPFSLTDLRELKTTMHTIDKIQHFNKVDHQSGRTPMERFALQTQEALRQANNKVHNLKNKYAQLLEYFGEDDKMPSNEFFGVMRRFIEEFEKACDQVDKEEKERIKQEKREAKRAEQEKVKEEKVAKKKAARLASKPVLANLATKKASLTDDGDSSRSDPLPKENSGGGIAALAAAAAAKKKQGEAKDKPQGGIAALAAAAAAKKSGPAMLSKTESGGKSSLAAALSSDSNQGEKSNEKETPSVGGIAAMAAAAAAKKKGGEASKDATPRGGLAAMAAASAKKKEESKGGNLSSGGSIAAMAAAAATKKQDNGEPTAQYASPAPTSGGIAVMAAAAAKKGGKSQMSAISSSGGGIAAMAAASTRKKAMEKSSPEDASPGGGLAAMAAAATKTRGKNPRAGRPSTEVETPSLATSNDADECAREASAGSSPLPGVGIAAMAAGAAAEKRQSSAGRKNSSDNADIATPASHINDDASALGEGLAAMAAAAKKRQTSDSASNGTSLAMMAAADKSKLDRSASGGDLSTMAASVRQPSQNSSGISSGLPEGRKRKVYDEQTGLYHEKNNTQQLSAVIARDALFQLGSSDQANTHRHGRLLPVRSKTMAMGNVNRKPVLRQRSGDGSIFVRKGIGRSKSTSLASTEEVWAAKSSTFPPNTLKDECQDQQLYGLPRSRSQGSETTQSVNLKSPDAADTNVSFDLPDPHAPHQSSD